MTIGKLDVERVLGVPFRPESLFLRALANGTTTLARINAVIGMTSRTMGLLTVDVADGGAVAKDILDDGDGLEVLRIHARPIAAQMIDDVTFRQVSVKGEPCDPMCPAVSAAEIKGAVAVFVQGTLPQ